ncbi:hypothetical protein TRFO_33597 [Tritrichomonas foetus]|uniref:Uncharacterized protein n=1 Tax=Tritrichomonas foetus TaxID=1144522 RepID=A0A1J4JL60_9EUKA|nr:hypothetical protein TRFO_33597 [Tritrichomonas foetus]|eukprot:OHS99848.1 hypothetical protein TRFO_33597 [Tritrichomonas foetus]
MEGESTNINQVDDQHINLASGNATVDDDKELLRVELHNKSELLKKSQNENQNLRKKYKELLDMVKSKNDEQKRKEKKEVDSELTQWRIYWEKVVSLMTEIIPFTIPKDIDSTQQRNILLELTNQLYQYAKNTTGSSEYKILEQKYKLNKQKLIKLKTHCNSLLDLLQKSRIDHQKANKKRSHDENQGFSENIFEEQFKYLESVKRRTNSRFILQPVHDDILCTNRVRHKHAKKSHVLHETNSNKVAMKNSNKESSTMKNTCIKNSSKLAKINDHTINNSTQIKTIDSLLPVEDETQHINEVVHLVDESVVKPENIIEINNEKIEVNNINEDDVIKDIQDEISLNNQLNNISSCRDASEELRKMVYNAVQHQTDSSNQNLISKQMKSFSISNPNSISIINQQSPSIIKNNTDVANIDSINIKSKVSANANIQSNVSRKKTNDNLEFSEQAAEQIIGELESTIPRKKEKSKIKAELMNHRVNYGRRVNELIDATNKLKEQYNKVDSKYRIDLDDIILEPIQDPLLIENI